MDGRREHRETDREEGERAREVKPAPLERPHERCDREDHGRREPQSDDRLGRLGLEVLAPCDSQAEPGDRDRAAGADDRLVAREAGHEHETQARERDSEEAPREEPLEALADEELELLLHPGRGVNGRDRLLLFLDGCERPGRALERLEARLRVAARNPGREEEDEERREPEEPVQLRAEMARSVAAVARRRSEQSLRAVTMTSLHFVRSSSLRCACHAPTTSCGGTGRQLCRRSDAREVTITGP